MLVLPMLLPINISLSCFLSFIAPGMDKTVAPEKEGDGGVRPKSQSPTPKGTAPIHFYSGNPMVEKVKGILHIYKDK